MFQGLIALTYASAVVFPQVTSDCLVTYVAPSRAWRRQSYVPLACLHSTHLFVHLKAGRLATISSEAWRWLFCKFIKNAIYSSPPSPIPPYPTHCYYCFPIRRSPQPAFHGYRIHTRPHLPAGQEAVRIYQKQTQALRLDVSFLCNCHRVNRRMIYQAHRGNAIVIAAITLINVGLTFGGTRFPWNSAQVLAPLISGIFLLGVFAWYEVTIAQEPAVPSDILRNRTTVSG